MKRRIHFCHYDTIWSYPISEAKKLAEKGAQGEGHSLDDRYLIKTKPRRYVDCEGRSRIMSGTAFNCLDWGQTEWQYFLDNDFPEYQK